MLNRSVIYKKITLMLISALLCSFILGGCGSAVVTEHTDTAASDADKTGPSIGIVFDSFVIERWECDRDIFTSTAKELGANVIVGNANGDVNEQISIIDHMIENHVDLLVIVAVDGKTLTESVEKAHKAGIKVISYDRIVNNADTDLYITFDNGEVGRFMAEVINDALPDGGKYMKVNGSSTDYNVTLVNEGFDKTINDNITLIDEKDCADWNDEEAYDYLTAHPEDISDADAFMCGNDSIAGQVVRVLSEQRRAGDVTVTGQDADLEACQRIVEGTQAMTVYKPIEDLAGQAAKIAVEMANGSGPDTDKTISDGAYDVPYISIEPIKVTADNIDDTVIAGGFHMKDDVYLYAGDVSKNDDASSDTSD